jgi:hypothetical protein
MKRVLLIGFILAICILAMPQGVLAADYPKTIPVDAQYGLATDFTVTPASTSGVWNWNLQSGAPFYDNHWTQALLFSVTTSYDWSVAVADTSSLGSGRHVYGFMEGNMHNLLYPFEMTLNAGRGAIKDSSNVKDNGHPSFSAQTWYADFWQPVADNDYGSTTGYAITLTFTCTSEF